jgi:phosphotransferase system enzyme I (PtsI)
VSLALTGLGVTSGIALGRVHRLTPGELSIPEYHLDDSAIGAELERLHKAFGRSEKFLSDLLARMGSEITDTARDLLEAHRLILRDPMLIDSTAGRIRNDRINAEWALVQQADQLQNEFRRMGDEYLASRREDLEQAVGLVSRELADQPALMVSTQVPHRLENIVVVASELGPADMTILSQRKVAGLITEHGGPWSHAAILARSLEIPMLVGVPRALDLLTEDETVILDGHYGAVLTGVDEGLLDHYREKREASRRRRLGLRRYLTKPSLTTDGQPFVLLGNADLLPDFERCHDAGVEAIGLMRTEYLFLENDLPDEDTQYRAYRQAVEIMQGRPITIRTLDVGGDKLPDILGFTKGPNPALGLRGLRLSLSLKDLFTQQIRAILRASVHGPVEILLPMLTRTEEIKQARKIIDECRQALSREGLALDPAIAVGGMIETPAAAIAVDALAEELDFLSIGTNDLIQYVLAIDRSDELVDYLYDPTHAAVLFLLKRIQKAAVHHGVPVTVCGELAGDERTARLLLGLGLNRLSMPPAALPSIKKSLLDASAEHCQQVLQRWMDAKSTETNADLLAQLSPE